MNTRIAAIQAILGITQDGVWGHKSETALRDLIKSNQNVAIWPFGIRIVGNDICIDNIVITCFGGWGGGNNVDPQDSGATASGVNTKYNWIEGVSIAMDGRQFSTLSSAEHKALDGAPVPRLFNEKGLTAWHTPVVVTIDGVSRTPKDGIVDLGPGLQATKDINEPHGCDLTVPAAQLFEPNVSLRHLATNFKKRGSIRIINGAKLGRLI